MRKKVVSNVVLLGQSNNSENVRADKDFYATDPECLESLLLSADFAGFTGGVWECACGTGNLTGVLEQFGYAVYSTDIEDRGFGVTGVDFFTVGEMPDGCQNIVTNPPYFCCTEFVRHALDILPSGGVGAFLLNITYLGSVGRYKEWYESGDLKDVFVFIRKVGCWKNGDVSTRHSAVNYAWFIFEKGYSGRASVHWI